MNKTGMDLILAGVVCCVITMCPDKSFGYGIGIGIILLGLCVQFTKENIEESKTSEVKE